METDNKRPNAALINREWFEAASNVLGADDLGLVLVNACRYVYGLPEIAMKTPVQRAVFAMIKPALDSDVDKYVERCARNAANARSQSQRVAASGTQSQRVGANTTTTSTTTTTTTSTSTPSLSPAEVEQRDRWLVFGYFWSTGSKAVEQELDAFWSYYESLGWKNNKGAAIVSKVACARMWKRQYETGCAPNGADAWYKALQSSTITHNSVFKCYAGAERVDDKAIVRLRCSKNYLQQLMTAVPTLERQLRALWRVSEITFETAD